MKGLILPTLRTYLIGVMVLGVLLFVPAGTLNYWQAWVFIVVFLTAANALGIYLSLNNPELLERRKQFGPKAEQTTAQKIIITLSIFGFLGLLVFSALDHRFGWSPAGTVVWVAGWVFLGLFYVGGIAITIWLRKVNPALLQERVTGLNEANMRAWDIVIVAMIVVLYFVWWVIMPLDAVRFQWSHIPVWVQVVGGILYCVSFYIIFLVYRENSYLSPAVRIQRERGQQVISTGPYRYIRHPMYAGFLLYFFAGSLLLGSWGGVLVTLLMLGVLARRAVLEEKLLREELPGYVEYMARVKYRLVPGLW